MDPHHWELWFTVKDENQKNLKLMKGHGSPIWWKLRVQINSSMMMIAQHLLVIHQYLFGMDPSEKNFIVFL